jgi:hypothetical protein
VCPNVGRRTASPIVRRVPLAEWLCGAGSK